MTLLFDTSILVDLEKKDMRTIKKVEELRKMHYLPAAVSFVNYFEFYFGVLSKSIENRHRMMEFLNKFNCLKASNKTAEILAELRYKYDKKGVTLPLADLIIASQTIENNMFLITKDNDFEKITEIKKIIL